MLAFIRAAVDAAVEMLIDGLSGRGLAPVADGDSGDLEERGQGGGESDGKGGAGSGEGGQGGGDGGSGFWRGGGFWPDWGGIVHSSLTSAYGSWGGTDQVMALVRTQAQSTIRPAIVTAFTGPLERTEEEELAALARLQTAAPPADPRPPRDGRLERLLLTINDAVAKSAEYSSRATQGLEQLAAGGVKVAKKGAAVAVGPRKSSLLNPLEV